MTINAAYQQLLHQLYKLYDNREAENIANWVIEFITNQKRVARIINKDVALTQEQQLLLQRFTNKLLNHQPVQYVLNEAWFAGMRFYVDESVLIPRPETEELVELISNFKFQVPNNLNILDIGTGSGCIPISLKKKLPNIVITGLDISANALAIAKKNAANLEADVTFKQIDFLDENTWYALGQFNIIVSNPPYIKLSESSTMSKHVTSYEPSIALFVADNDVLIFYKKIAKFGKTHLTKAGHIFVEINEILGNETLVMFEDFGYTTMLIKDLQGKDRMIQAWLQ